ncbi:copper resistance protein CopC [Nocardioides sp.]|uniref:copper resistance protein CopC n=1 Tax=Nocardioides sp. TaxID=35761 RepID=UPI0039E470C8
MECSDAREALSAWADGETSPHREPEVRAHVAGCPDCAAFADALAALAVTVAPREEAPDLAPAILARLRASALRRKRESRVFLLRWGVGLMGGAELLNAVYELVAHGLTEVHATHESLSFTIAICLGLVLAALRPWQAAAYVPVLGTAVALLGFTAGLDVASGRVGWTDELPHVDLLAGFVLLWLLGREDTGGPTPRRAGLPRRPRPPAYGGLRVVRRVAVRPAKVALGTLRWPLQPGRLLRDARHARRLRCRRATAHQAAFLLRLAAARTGRRSRRRRAGAAAALAGALVMLIAGPASAHAVLESSSPGPDEVVQTLPAQVELRFNESITLPEGGTQVFGPDGDRVDAGTASVSGTEIDIPLSGEGAQGTYVVSFRVVSADSHPVSGAFSFSVGAPSAAPVVPERADTTGLQVGLGVARWVGYAGAALLVGGLVFLCWCWPGGWQVRRMRLLVLAGAVLLLAGAVASLLIKGPLDAGGGRPLSGPLLREVLASTYGRATLTRAVLALLGVVVVLARRTLSVRDRGIAAGVLGVAIAVTFALAGHAVAADLRVASMVSESAHVIAMCVWLGGLVLLVAGTVWRLPEARAVLGRFSTAALGAVAVLVLTGAFQVWRQVGSIDALTATTYGREVAVKTGLVIMAVGVAAGSRSLLRRSAASSGSGLVSLRQSVGIEVVLVGAVLGVTAALVATEPAKSAYRPTVAENLTLAGDAVQVSAVPAGDRQSDLHVYVFDSSGQPSDPAEITAAMVMPSQGIGPLPVDLDVAGPGHRQALLSVPVAGEWRLSVTVRTSDFDEQTGYVDLPVR